MTTEAEAKTAFLDALAEGESDPVAKREGISPYFILLGGGSFEKMPRNVLGFPIWSGLSGSWGVSHAAGRYQFQPGTWAQQAVKLGLTDFSVPAQQDAAAWDLAATVFAGRTGGHLIDELLSARLVGIANILHSTWTSLSEATFTERYDAALDRGFPPAKPAPATDPSYLAAVLALEAPERMLVQQGLAWAKLYSGAIDGLIGPLSRAALAANRAQP
jgi:muramidase (phage lysozyme)